MGMIPDFFVKRYLGKLSDFVEGETCKVLGVKEEIKKLQRRIVRISGFLQDAEKRSHENPVINEWVRELKDVLYDADDIIDLCMFEGGKLLEVHQSASRTVGSCFSLLPSCFKCTRYRHEIANRIEGLNDRLKEIAEDSEITSRLAEYTKQVPSNYKVNIRSRETSPTEVKEDLVGTQIEDAAQNLIKSILEHDKGKCGVFGIVGMGGIGKTTLARKIFNDERIKQKFPKRIWLYVSKDYSEIGLLREIVRGAGGNDAGAQSRAELETKIASLLSTNLFVVLDDAWSSNVWKDSLRNPILSGGACSKILVTTRYEKVAMDMRASYIHQVVEMDKTSGWELFRKIVFGDEEEIMSPELKEVGIEIVKKCDGLPLAIKVMAGLLISKKRTRREWEKVLESDSWRMNQIDDELPRALYLSYEDLPPHLKQCFLSCALYKGIAHNSDLIRLWVAEGFIVEQRDGLMEELAEDYYKELIWRNLLQTYPSIAGRSFTMHDLLRSFGVNLIKEEGITICGDQRLNTNPLTKIRRLTMSNEGYTLTFPDAIIQQNCLRALHLVDSYETRMIEDNVFERLTHLRVLNLSDTSIESIPDSIGKLLHLRYLDLDRTKIRELPESIGGLANLQTLNFAGCRSLHLVPNAITRLDNLRCLRMGETPLTHVAKGIGRLTNLNHLGGFVVGDDEGCDLEELQFLSTTTYLSIRRLERARTGASVLANKPFLRRLSFGWTKQGHDSEEQIWRAEKIGNELVPPSILEDLRIYNFPGRQCPSWMMSASLGASFAALTYLVLGNFASCTELPPLGQLPQLKILSITGAEAIKSIGPAFLGCGFPGTPAFPKLELLLFENMPNWEEWILCKGEEVGDDAGSLKLLPNLKHFYIMDCPRLRALPDGLCHATNLKELHLWRAQNLREINNLSFLTDKLNVTNNERLERISNLPSLRYLSIEHYPSLQYVENLDKLHRLFLQCPPTSEHLPQWLSGLIKQHQSAPSAPHSFTKFQMACSLPLLKSCLKGEENWHIIEQIPKVEINTYNGKNFMTYAKDPHMCETNVDSE